MAIIISVVLILLALIFLGISYYAYRYAIKADNSRQALEDEIPDASFRPKAIKNIYALLSTPFESVNITSFDNLTLHGRYYHFKDGAPLAIVFHGYRSNYCRDGNGAFVLLKDMGVNILMPDQRAHGKSEGKVISYGINERWDCKKWVEYAIHRFGGQTQIVLVGVSMGAATVMMASDIVPAENVKAIVADCGYTSPKEIISHVAKSMKLPSGAGYFFTRLGARIFGGVDTDKWSSVKSLESTTIPCLFIHGEDDGFVPHAMGKECYEKCRSYKEFFSVPKATHGISYYIDTEGYTKTAKKFLEKFVEL